MASIEDVLPGQWDIPKHIVFWTVLAHTYWIVTRRKVEIVEVGVVQSAVPPLLVSGVCHPLQLSQVQAGYGSDQHGDGKEGGEEGAEEVGGYALGRWDW